MSDSTENPQSTAAEINPDIIGGEPISTGLPARPPVEDLSREPLEDFVIKREPVQVEPVPSDAPSEQGAEHDQEAGKDDQSTEAHDQQTQTHDKDIVVPVTHDEADAAVVSAEPAEAVTVDAGSTILDQSGEGVVTDRPATVSGDPTVVEVVDSTL